MENSIFPFHLICRTGKPCIHSIEPNPLQSHHVRDHDVAKPWQFHQFILVNRM
jgi:hypothetical protein